MARKKTLDGQFAAHDRAATRAIKAGASPRDAAIKGMVAELLYQTNGKVR